LSRRSPFSELLVPPANPRVRMERFIAQSARSDHEGALATIEEVIADFPNQVPLLWYRIRTLRSLGRDAEALEYVESLLRFKTDFAPAWLMRAELGTGSAQEADLRQTIKLDPTLARAHLLLARQLSAQQRRGEAQDALERSIGIDPLQAEAYADRGDAYRRDAAQGFGDNGPPDPDILISRAGQRWSRSLLEATRDDYRHSLEIKDDPVVRLKIAEVLHDLQDYDAALAAFDAVLYSVPMDDPRHAQIRAQRAMSASGLAGDLQPYAAPEDARERTDEAEIAPPVRREPIAVHRMSVAQAQAEFADDHPDDARVASIALGIVRLASVAPPEFQRTDISRFPSFQQEHALTAAKSLAAQAFRIAGDFESSLLSAAHGPTLLRFYVSNDGVSCGSSYAFEPAERGFARLWQRVRGKWKRSAICDFESNFDDGCFLVTTNASADHPFVHRGGVERVQLAAESSPASVYSRHRARIERYRREHPHATARRVDTDERIVDLQLRLHAAKIGYRESIGYVDDKELRHVLGADYEELAWRVRDKVGLMLAAQRGR